MERKEYTVLEVSHTIEYEEIDMNVIKQKGKKRWANFMSRDLLDKTQANRADNDTPEIAEKSESVPIGQTRKLEAIRENVINETGVPDISESDNDDEIDDLFGGKLSSEEDDEDMDTSGAVPSGGIVKTETPIDTMN